MKEANYNHLNLDSFMSIQSERCTHPKKHQRVCSVGTPTLLNVPPAGIVEGTSGTCETLIANTEQCPNRHSQGHMKTALPLRDISNLKRRTAPVYGYKDSSKVARNPNSAPLNFHVCSLYTPVSFVTTENHPQHCSEVDSVSGSPMPHHSSPLSTVFPYYVDSQNTYGIPRRAPLTPEQDFTHSRLQSQKQTDSSHTSVTGIDLLSTISSTNLFKSPPSGKSFSISKDTSSIAKKSNTAPYNSHVVHTMVMKILEESLFLMIENQDFVVCKAFRNSRITSRRENLFWDDDYINPYIDHAFKYTIQTEPGSSGYCSLGPPTEFCSKCDVVMWKEKRTNKNVKNGTPKFSLCCCQGQIKLPPTPPTPSYLLKLYTDLAISNYFRRRIRMYNAMFAFTSMGGKIDYSINCGRAPYVYRLNGQNHHVFGTLIPNEGNDPKFCQLYIYDTEHKIENHMKWIKVDDGDALDVDIVEGLVKMLDETNQLVRKFRTARDRFKENPVRDLKIKLKVCRSESGRENMIGPSDKVACVMVGDIDTTVGDRDIIVEKKLDVNSRDIVMEKSDKVLERISSVHPSLTVLQYPLLFPLCEDGYIDQIPYVDSENQNKKKRKRITMKEYYAYRFQVRRNEGLHVRLGGRLYRQYVVDAFSCGTVPSVMAPNSPKNS
ncbi:uncharacterized protein LOC141668168 isoform X2 [Apium graveolens]|uniref:uncharacterized protein LOC141668168 isoform X2 n=1 Tax=Apium graveolens TaxID=4045 RepID=UPI003D79DB3B